MIILMRHGQTEWNEKQIFRGQKDIPLSREGKAQAHRTAKYLKVKNVVKIYSSPLKRAYETASIIAEEVSCTVKILHELTDIHYGDWEGKQLEWVKENDSENYYLYRNFPELVIFPKGESLESCCMRTFDAFHTLVTQLHKSHNRRTGNYLFVTHRVVLKLILLRALGLNCSSFWKLQVDTCSLNELDYINNIFLIKCINGVCHLKKGDDTRPDF